MRLSVLSPSVVGALLAPALLLSACSGEVSVGGPATVERAVAANKLGERLLDEQPTLRGVLISLRVRQLSTISQSNAA